jgi:biopolymer transport protein ExbD
MGGSTQGGGRGRKRQSLAEINVTPLVDVMLVLLIISMIAAPMLERGINLDLPRTETAGELPEVNIQISLDRDGRIWVNNKRVHDDSFEERMRLYATRNPTEIVYIRADASLPYGEVLGLMDHVRKAGLTRISLVTELLEEIRDGG